MGGSIQLQILSQYYGPSPDDAPNRFSMTGTYFVSSAAPNNVFLNRVTGGWELSESTILQSGYPFTVSTSAPFEPISKHGNGGNRRETGCGDYNADGDNNDWPNAPATGSSQPHSRNACIDWPLSSFRIFCSSLGDRRE